MTAVSEWWEALPGDPLPWLLDPRFPNVAWRTLVELVGRPEDSAAVRRARGGASAAEPVATLLAPLLPDGSWNLPGEPWSPGGSGWRLVAAVELGADPADPRLRGAAERLLEGAAFAHGWDAAGGVGPLAAVARAVAAMAELGAGGHVRVQEAAARLEELPWRCRQRDPHECRAVAVAVLLAATREPRLRRPPLVERAVSLLIEEPETSPELPSHPNLEATDPVEECWALALAGVPPDPRLVPRLDRVQRLAGEGGRWPAAVQPPPQLEGLCAPRWHEAVRRFVTLHATVALSRYAVALGLERRFPRRPE